MIFNMAFLPLVMFALEIVQGEVAALQPDGASEEPPVTKVLADICFLGGQICVSRTSYYVFIFVLITFFVLIVAFVIVFVIFIIKTKILSRPQRPRTRLFERLEEVVGDQGEVVPETSTPVRPSSASLHQLHQSPVEQEPEGVQRVQQGPLGTGPVPESISPNNVEINVRSISSSGTQSSDGASIAEPVSSSSYSEDSQDSQDSQDSESPGQDDNLVTNRSNSSRFHG